MSDVSEPRTRGFASRTTMAIVAAAVAASLVVAVVLTLFSDDLAQSRQPATGPDSYSRSALGYRGLIALLRQLDIPVERSRGAAAPPPQDALLIIAEPHASDEETKQRLINLISESPRTLIVLPKWIGSAEPGEPWIAEVERVPASEISDVLDAIGADAALAASPAEQREATSKQLLSADSDVEVDTELAGGILVGEVPEPPYQGRVWVLSDPDILNNHGLRNPETARMAVALIDRLREGGPVIFEETVHGYTQTPGLVRTLFRFPLVLATIQILICGLLAGWAAMVWFGPRRAAPPPLAAGKDFLISNTASLLLYGGHHHAAVRRYLAHSVSVVRGAVFAPTLSAADTVTWLDRLAAARGLSLSLQALEAQVANTHTPAQAIITADAIYRWRLAMTQGKPNATV